MAHPRKLLRAAVVAALKAGNTAAGASVEPFRAVAASRPEGTCLGVYTPQETSRRVGFGLALERDVAVFIIGFVRASGAADAADAADDLAEEIEAIWRADDTFGWSGAMRSLLTATTIDVQSGQQHVAELQMTFSVTVQSGAPVG